jgi:hypothetical protein
MAALPGSLAAKGVVTILPSASIIQSPFHIVDISLTIFLSVSLMGSVAFTSDEK